jgi:hypothetical protein
MIVYCALLTGYFGYLATFYFKLQFGPLAGGHMGSGPPSGAGTLGTAATTYVLTNISIRNNALIRFIGFSPCTKVTERRLPSCARIITPTVKFPDEFSSTYSGEYSKMAFVLSQNETTHLPRRFQANS